MEAEKTRSIRLPENIWNALDEDAARCRRSSQKQLEALLVSYYGIEDIEMNKQKLEILGEIAPRSSKTVPLIRTKTKEKKKRA